MNDIKTAWRNSGSRGNKKAERRAVNSEACSAHANRSDGGVDDPEEENVGAVGAPDLGYYMERICSRLPTLELATSLQEWTSVSV